MNGTKIAELLKCWQSGRDYLNDEELRELLAGLTALHGFHVTVGESLYAVGVGCAITGVRNALIHREMS